MMLALVRCCGEGQRARRNCWHDEHCAAVIAPHSLACQSIGDTVATSAMSAMNRNAHFLMSPSENVTESRSDHPAMRPLNEARPPCGRLLPVGQPPELLS